jgi:hypothetical protein
VRAAADDPAAHFPIGGLGMTKATEVAERYWGGVPCHGQVAYSWVSSLPGDIESTAAWNGSPPGSGGDYGANNSCAIVFSTAWPYDWPRLCTAMTHEIGHLLGHPHASDPQDVMYPSYVAPIAACMSVPDPEPQQQPASATTSRATDAEQEGAAAGSAASRVGARFAGRRARHAPRRRKHHASTSQRANSLGPLWWSTRVWL